MATRSAAPTAMRFAATMVALLGAASISVPTPAAAGRSARSRWHVTKSFRAKNTEAEDIVAFPDGSAWAGGETAAQTPVLYHLHSGHWTSVPLPGGAGSFVAGMAATTTKNVWATIANEPDVARLTHHRWVLVSFANGADEVLMSGVITFGPKNTWVFTYDYTTKLASAHHDNGSSWTTTKLPANIDGNSQIRLVSASSPTNIWALVSTASGVTATMRYNGHKWRVVKLPTSLVPAGNTLFGRQIFAQSAKNVWATIYTYKGSVAGPITLAHWNGHHWRRVGGKVPTGVLTGPIASDGKSGLWLGAATRTGKPFFLHYHSGKWAKHASPTDPRGSLTMESITLIPGTSALLGVADVGQTFGGTNGIAIVRYGK